jgi:class 3 adenylate cyclase
MAQRYFDQIYQEADQLLSRPDFDGLMKTAREKRRATTDGAFSMTDLLEAAAEASGPGTAIAQVGKQIGHPRYQQLEFGRVERANAVVLFMDVRGFTRLSIELENDELIRILQRLSIASVATVYHRGGYIGDFTGDGIMAFFDGNEPATAALLTGAELLSGVRDVVNPALKRDGDTGVRVAVGIEYGEVAWTRIGFAGISQVKPVSEVTYVAGKLATREHSEQWECSIGEQLAAVVPQQLTKRSNGISYGADKGDRSTYQVYIFDWEQFERQYGTDATLRRNLTTAELKARNRRAGIAASLAPASAVSRGPSPSIPGPAVAPVPPKNRQVG